MSDRTPSGGRPDRTPPLATPRHLENAALFYLQRYSSSAGNLRRVLMRRVFRSVKAHDSDPEEGRVAVERVIERLTSAGLLDDRRYADATARSLARSGRSTRGVRATLARKGVPADFAEEVLDQMRAEEPEMDLKAAVVYARRRRFGPFRDGTDRRERRERDLAAMARAGYPLSIARQVIDAEDAEFLKEQAADLF